MIRVRSPKRELGHPRVRRTFYHPTTLWLGCLSVNLRNSGQKGPYFCYGELATFCLWTSLIGGFLDLNRACNLGFDLEAF